MEVLWTALAALVISVLSGALTAGIVMTIGGVGVLRSMHRRLVITEERIEDVDTRITSEVKKRAAGIAVEAKTKARNAQEEVDAALASATGGRAPPGGTQGRRKPSVVSVVSNRG